MYCRERRREGGSGCGSERTLVRSPRREPFDVVNELLIKTGMLGDTRKMVCFD